MENEEPRAKYCYHCGNRLIESGEVCWYCESPVHRGLKTSKSCKYCGEVIREVAIKCRHCGEFQDEQKPPFSKKKVDKIIEVDSSLLPIDDNLYLFPGMPVPELARKVLDSDTVRSIEEGQIDQINVDGININPAPDGSAIYIKIPEVPNGERGDYLTDKVKKSTPEKIIKKSAGQKVEDSPYRICFNCQVEIFAIDNYCYNCGTQHRRTEMDDRRLKARKKDILKERIKNTFKFLLTLALILILLELKTIYDTVPNHIDKIFAIVIAIICIALFSKSKSYFGKIAAIILLVIDGLAYFVFK